MKVNPPGFNKGSFITSYLGENFKIKNSVFRLNTQKIWFNKSLLINGNSTEKCCFTFTILNRKFLMVLDEERIYEVLEDEGEKVFILLTNSRMYIKNHFIGDLDYIVQGVLFLRFSYSQYAEFDEEFDYQLNLINHKFMIELLENINV